MLYDELIEQSEREFATTEQESWKIYNDQQAEWWIKKHQFEMKDVERNQSIIKEELRILNEKAKALEEKKEWYQLSMQAKLIEYFESLPDDIKKKTKTLTKYTLPSVEIIRKVQNPEIIQGDDFLEYLKENRPEYVQVVEKPKWGEYKKLTALVDGAVIDTETGEVVKGLAVVLRPDKYEFK